jgi:translation initiation factor IF-3
MAHQQLGLAQLQKIEADVAEWGVVEQAKNGRSPNGHVTWT